MDDIVGSGNFLPEEIQFFAEDCSVSVVPNFSLPTAADSSLSCLTHTYGPFQPNTPVEVPLWLALALQKRKRCRIQRPAWLQVGHLQDVLEAERNHADGFQELPFHYLEMAQALMRHAKEDFGEDLYKVRDLVESIRKLRSTKIDAGLADLRDAMTVKLNNLSALECNTIRPFFQGALDAFHRLSQMDAGAGGSQWQLQTQDTQEPLRQLRRW